MYDEQARQLEESHQRNERQDGYVTELRSRVAKLDERSKAGEAHVHDLESQLKIHVEREESLSSTAVELRKETGKLKPVITEQAARVDELESGLARAEEEAARLRHAADAGEIRQAALVEENQKLEGRAAEAEARCADAEAKVAELSAQLADAKLVQSELEDSVSEDAGPITPVDRRGPLPLALGPSGQKQGFRIGRGFGESRRAV